MHWQSTWLIVNELNVLVLGTLDSVTPDMTVYFVAKVILSHAL